MNERCNCWGAVNLFYLKEENEMMNILRRLWKEEEGQGMVEYGLIIALIAIVVITALRLTGTNLTAIFNKIASAIN